MPPRKKVEPDVKLDILIGVAKAGAYSSTKPEKNAVVGKLKEVLDAKLAEIKKHLVTEELTGLEDVIANNLIRDVKRFMDQMTNYFMRIQFSMANRDVEVFIDDEKARADGPNLGMRSKGNAIIITKGRMEQWMDGRGQPLRIVWPSLAASTIKRKVELIHPGNNRVRVPKINANGVKTFSYKTIFNDGRKLVQSRQLDPGAANYYFHWSGELKNVISDAIYNMLLGGTGIISPSVKFVTIKSSAPGVANGDRIGTIKVRLFNRTGFPTALRDALGSGDYKSAIDDQSMLNKYLSRRVSEKLGPSRQALTDNKRPWVGPSIAYWIINRFPYIVRRSIDETIAQHKKKKNTTNVDKASISL